MQDCHHPPVPLTPSLDEVMQMSTLAGVNALALDDEISDAGGNLSLGQMQLVCLARALLSDTKILILDEATASVDAETDDRIQHLINSEFKTRTVLTIAHRLHTLARSDRIFVLGAGKLAEVGHPKDLMADGSSAFAQMVKEGGDKNVARVNQMLQEHHGGTSGMLRLC